MHPVPGQVSTRARRVGLNINLRRLKMRLTKDDMNRVVDTMPEAAKTITFDKDEEGNVIMDLGDFLTVFANAVLDYTNSSEFTSMKEDVA
jgi:hypothetical protein